MSGSGEELMKRYAEDYMAQMFYFCLKKTRNGKEAEDLAGDISLNIIAALGKGTVPVNFSAWVWQIARNAYSRWVFRRHQGLGPGEADISEYEIADGRKSMEEERIYEEELKLLRRELAFIAADYRDILVAYYMETKKTQEIADALNLPKGTVVSKLFRARKILKEGMEMAREFGSKSYKPENVEFCASGYVTESLPWGAVARKMPTNILLEAAQNPSTLEELAISLGTALPYMEEEVELLEKATLLKKVGNQYITNFLIISKEARMQLYYLMRGNSQVRSELLDKIVSETLGELRRLGIVRGGMDDNSLKWWAVIYAADYFLSCIQGICNIWEPEERENGDRWGFVGYEDCTLPEDNDMGVNKNVDVEEKAAFCWYSIVDYNMYRRAGALGYTDALFLRDIIRNRRSISSFTEIEKERWKRIENVFAHAEADGSITPDIPVLEGSAAEEIKKIWSAHPLAGKLTESLQTLFEDCKNILRKNNSPLLENQLSYYASMEIQYIRMITVRDEVDSGRLAVPEVPERSTVAMWLELKE